jgi:glycosyltransferase involved in cell wall biosynthesis
MPKVLFALRQDAASKPGGDTTKVAKYIDHLKASGFETDTTSDVRAIKYSRAQIVHLVNLDLPIENLRFAEAANHIGAKVVISSVYHPRRGKEQFYRLGQDRFYQGMNRLGSSYDRAATTRELLKLNRASKEGRLSLVRSVIRPAGNAALQRELVDRVDAVYPMTLAEANGIANELSCAAKKLRLIANGFSFATAQGTAAARNGILSVGRVEPRKNQVQLIEAIAGLGIPTTFVGALNHRHPSYVREFRKQLSKYPHLRHMDHTRQQDLIELYDNVRLHVSGSWMEVVSQADLEAASRGCAVVATLNSYADSYFESGYHQLDPGLITTDPARYATIVRAVYDAAESPKIVDGAQRTWGRVTAELTAAYSELL